MLSGLINPSFEGNGTPLVFPRALVEMPHGVDFSFLQG